MIKGVGFETSGEMGFWVKRKERRETKKEKGKREKEGDERRKGRRE